MEGDEKSNESENANGENFLKSERPVYCKECSIQCLGGVRKKNCSACAQANNWCDDFRTPSFEAFPPCGTASDRVSFQVSTCRDNKTNDKNLDYFSIVNNGKSRVIDSDSSDDNDEADNCCFYTYKGMDLVVENEEKSSDRSARMSSSSEMDYLEMDFDPGTSNGHDCSDDSGHSATHCCPEEPCSSCPDQCCQRPSVPPEYVMCPATPHAEDSDDDRGELEEEHYTGISSTELLQLCSALDPQNPLKSSCFFDLHLDRISCEIIKGEPSQAEKVECRPSYRSTISGKQVLCSNPSSQFISYIFHHLDCYKMAGFIDDTSSLLGTDETPMEECKEEKSYNDCRLVNFLNKFISEIPTLSGLLNACGCDTYISRTFYTFPPRNFELCRFLLHWIYRGAVPVISFIDSFVDWQDCLKSLAVFAVSSSSIAFGNEPDELVAEDVVMKMLSAPPTLRISRKQILSLWSPSANFGNLGLVEEWKKYNILGQVVNLIRENMKWDDASTTCITIPSQFKPQLTLIMESSSPYVTELQKFPELPLASAEASVLYNDDSHQLH